MNEGINKCSATTKVRDDWLCLIGMIEQNAPIFMNEELNVVTSPRICMLHGSSAEFVFQPPDDAIGDLVTWCLQMKHVSYLADGIGSSKPALKVISAPRNIRTRPTNRLTECRLLTYLLRLRHVGFYRQQTTPWPTAQTVASILWPHPTSACSVSILLQWAVHLCQSPGRFNGLLEHQ